MVSPPNISGTQYPDKSSLSTLWSSSGCVCPSTCAEGDARDEQDALVTSVLEDQAQVVSERMAAMIQRGVNMPFPAGSFGLTATRIGELLPRVSAASFMSKFGKWSV